MSKEQVLRAARLVACNLRPTCEHDMVEACVPLVIELDDELKRREQRFNSMSE